MRTSQSHPLQIAWLRPGADVGTAMGRIGVTFCPGKKQAGSMTGGWDRDLAADLACVAAANVAAVVTLLEPHELTGLGVPGLAQAVRDHHMDWYPMPIRDAGVPGPRFEQAWTTTGAALRAIIRDGFDVLVHCKGGLGRAGMVAARLAVELGMDAALAVRQVREVRPGAIETRAQLDHVLGCSAIPPAAHVLAAQSGAADNHNVTSAQADRALGALLGLAVGDAIGTTLEFSVRGSKPRIEGMVGGGPFRLAPGQWTDDTAMALALADSLLACPGLDAADLMARFVDWHETGAYSCTGTCFDIGVTTRAALQRWKASGNPYAGSTDPRSAGNGSVMRLAPVAIRHWRDPARLCDIAARQSRTTHGAPEAVDACVAYAQVLADALAGHPRSHVLRSRSGAHAGRITQVMAGSWRGKPRDAICSTGYVVHSLEAALWCTARTGRFADAVLLAANLGEDADTTAAVTGQLAGALYGASAILPAWLDQLAWRETIADKALKLLKAGTP